MAEQKVLGRKSERSTSVGSNEELFSDLKKLLVEVFGTPWWISELSAMEDEVRDRTILVKIKSQMYSVDDLVIYHIFSEIGVVEDVKYLPAHSGFHSQVRFGSKHSRDWAYNYYSGRFLHQGCCELEVHKGDDLISWNAQKINEIKATYGISDVPVETCDANLHEEKLKCDELIHRDKDPSQIVVQNEPNAANVPSYFTAHQVLDEMPESQNCIKHNLCVDSLKDNDEGLCEVVNRIERDEEPSHILVQNEPNSAKESSVLVAHQVLDKMPMSFVSGELIFLDEIDLSSAEELTVRADAQIELAIEEIFLSDCGLFIENVACLDTFCFDPEGEKILSGFDSLDWCRADMKLSDVAAELLVDVLIFEVLIGSLFEVLIFDPGGHLLIHVAFGFSVAMLKLVLKTICLSHDVCDKITAFIMILIPLFGHHFG